MKRKLLLLLLLLFSFFLYQNPVTAQEDIATRSVTYSTSKGTSLDISTKLTHDGTQDSKPVLHLNQTYQLNVTVVLNELGGDAKDFHDLTLDIDLSTSGLLSSQSLFSAYYFDSTTRFTDAGQNKSYVFDILISGDMPETDGNLEITLSGRENVENNRDPSSTFDAISYEVIISGTGSFDSSLIGGSEVITKSIEQYTDKGTKLGIEVNMTHEGLVDSKPSLDSGIIYPVSVRIDILELGSDPQDFHDLELIVKMEDRSITDYIPGNDAVRYYSGYSSHEESLVAGDSIEFQLYLLANTNLNDTEVDLKFTVKGREDLNLAADPSSSFDIPIEVKLNAGKSNSALNSDDGPAPVNYLAGLVGLVLLVPVISRRRRSFITDFR